MNFYLIPPVSIRGRNRGNQPYGFQDVIFWNIWIVTLVLVFFAETVPAEGFDRLDQFEIHGFVSQGYLQSDRYDYLGQTEQGSFEFNELGINFVKELNRNLRLGIQFFAMDLGDYNNDSIMIDWAYGDYRYNDRIGFRAGKMKISMGLHNEARDIDAIHTFILLPGAIYDPGYRDTFSGLKGANIYGELWGGFSYHASYGVIAGSASSRVVNDIADNIRDVYNNLIPGVNLSYIIQDVRFTNTKNLGLRWNPSFTDGLQFSATYLGSEIDFDLAWDIPAGAIPLWVPLPPSAVHVDEASTTVLSVEYMIGSTVITGEYNMMKIDVRDVKKTDLLGWAVSLSHRITHWLDVGAYYSDLTTNVDDRSGDEYVALGRPAAERWKKDACAAVRFDLNEYWIVKLEAHLMDGLFQVDYGAEDNPSKTWTLFAGKISYTF